MIGGYSTDFYGNNLTWFVGFVEKSHEAETGLDKLNRVAVRIVGMHDNNATSDDLPLAVVLMPATTGGVPNVSANHGLQRGAMVIGFFLDNDKQHPMVIGTLGTRSSESRTEPDDVGDVVDVSGGV